jgi:exonuclease III
MLKGYLLKERIDLAFIQENDTSELKGLEPEYKYFTNCNEDGGSVAIVYKENLQVKEVRTDTDGRIIRCEIGGCKFVNIYAPSGSQNKKAREVFFEEKIAPYIPKDIESTVFLGDFNCITDKQDAIAQSDNICSSLKRFVRDAGFLDVWKEKVNTRSFTRISWTAYGGGARLDRIYTSSEILPQIEKIENKIAPFSDHQAVIATLKNNERKKSSFRNLSWKMNTEVLRNKDFTNATEKILEVLKTVEKSSLPKHWEKVAKPAITKMAQQISRDTARFEEKHVSFLYKVVYQLKEEINAGKNSNKEYFEALAEIREVEHKRSEAIKIRTKIDEHIQNEQLTTTLICREKKKISQQQMRRIIDQEGEVLENENDILNEARDYYQNVFKKEKEETEDEQKKVREFIEEITITKVTDEQNEMLISEITAEEIKKALSETGNNKSPGRDGIPYEFYKHHANEIAPILSEMFNEMLNSPEEKISCIGIMKLLPKSGNLEELKNWRPVNLTNCDYRILTKVLANRLKKVLSKVLSKRQKGGLDGRKTADVLRAIRNVIHVIEKKSI